eukprot:1158256-Pelagomonas_calceolata.AAC.5
MKLRLHVPWGGALAGPSYIRQFRTFRKFLWGGNCKLLGDAPAVPSCKEAQSDSPHLTLLANLIAMVLKLSLHAGSEGAEGTFALGDLNHTLLLILLVRILLLCHPASSKGGIITHTPPISRCLQICSQWCSCCAFMQEARELKARGTLNRGVKHYTNVQQYHRRMYSFYAPENRGVSSTTHQHAFNHASTLRQALRFHARGEGFEGTRGA